MAVTSIVLVQSQFAPDVQTNQYVVGPAKIAVIDKATVTNTGGVDAALSVNLIDTGPAGANNLIVNARNVPMGTSYLLPELVGQVLTSGQIISTLASVASTLTIRFSGREIGG